MAKFVNPYNFIPFEKEEIKKQTREEKYRGDKKLLSGWMEVSLYTKTPIIIPDGAHVTYVVPDDKENTNAGEIINNPSEKEKKELHKKIPFIKRDGKCIIPGSEIRGMLRSVYEASTNSCIRELMNSNPVSQRVPTFSSLNKRGLLGYENGRWTLYSADKILVKKCKDRKDFEEVIKKEGPTGKNYKDGAVLQYNNPVALYPPSPKNEKGQPYSIYKLKKSSIQYEWEKGDTWPYDKLKSSLFRDGVLGSDANSKCHKDLLTLLEEIKNGSKKLLPLYYFDVERTQISDEKEKKTTIVYLSGSSIGRIGNYRKWEDVFTRHAPCKGPEFCPACLLFGTIKENGLKSHIRITDATTEADTKAKVRTLDVLAQPRQTAFEFYYDKPNEKAKYWNIDFYSYQNGKDEPTSFFDLNEATPRGRKMYWHSIPDTKDFPKTKLNSTVETLKTDKPFKFKVFFDQITEDQLKDIKWVISLGDNSKDSNMLHKIGHAKPLGYGSSKLVIDKVCVRRANYQNNQLTYSIDEKVCDNKPITGTININSNSVKALCAMTDVTKTRNKKVAYPHFVNKGSDAVFNWFTNNRKNAKNLKVLPKPTDNNIELEGSWLQSEKDVRLGSDNKSGIRDDNKKEGVVKKLYTDKNNNKCGDIVSGNITARFYENACNDYNKLRVNDNVCAEIRKNKNNNYYTAYNVTKK